MSSDSDSDLLSDFSLSDLEDTDDGPNPAPGSALTAPMTALRVPVTTLTTASAGAPGPGGSHAASAGRPSAVARGPVPASGAGPGRRPPGPRLTVAEMTQFPLPGGPQVVSGGSQTPSRVKVALAPGHGPGDWLRLKRSGHPSLRSGQPRPRRINPSELRQHGDIYAPVGAPDPWMAIRGKVYNIRQYANFHPGGAEVLQPGCGKDATALFDKTHAWVNFEFLLQECLVGFLVPEGSGEPPF
ncbi:hypothetical protein H696_04245 [Fonticula alba]|uniref:Cytochrome b5 heme-binding domain-containing protein n=1 Tax=Fonticula alba TaxID=691883 RepID=A0A058Z4H5_FONAL|nr:hypothetical protein H696_04245 [Fonticula alba]KCV68828.1 hypothetical protein H696_04245 [Fonticula alba]|eukprot:XP_009496399.1 hypothetical protein H696_04245 [Fonticula alba]